MRKRILCSLVAILVVVALLPAETFAATNYSKVFANLTAADVAKYNTPLPSGGTKQSAAKIVKTLDSLDYKMPGKAGPVISQNYLLFSVNNGVLDYAYKYNVWWKFTRKADYAYSETKELINQDMGAVTPYTICMFGKIIGKTST